MPNENGHIELSIRHNEEGRSFVCEVMGHECYARYDSPEPHIMDVYKTFVHGDLRGKGIAEKLMLALCGFARQNSRKIRPTCSYTVVFFKRHQEFADLLEDGVDLEHCGSCRL